jgi:Ring finger domain
MVYYPFLFIICLVYAKTGLYLGTWNGKFTNFSETEGRIYFQGTPSLKSLSFRILMFDGQWESKPYAYIYGTSMVKSGNLFYLNNIDIEDHLNYYAYCKANGTIVFADGVDGTLASQPCEINLKYKVSEMTVMEYYRPKLIYFCFFGVIKLIEHFMIRKTLRYCGNIEIARSVNSITIILSAALDLFYFLWSLHLLNTGYVMSTQINFLFYLIFIPMPMISIKEKYQIYFKIINIQQNFPRRTRFYSYMFISGIYIAISSSFYYFNVILSNMIYLPQILTNLHQHSLPKYITGSFIMFQLLLTLYIVSNPWNFLVWEPDLFLSVCVFFICASQIVLLFWYKPLGSFEDYRNPLIGNQLSPDDIERIVQEVKDCAICLEPLSVDEVVITNCAHAYHNSCLSRWTEIQSICPVCRNDL